MAHRCLACNGRKTLIGLGNMLVKCKTCNGVGYTSPPEPKEEADSEQLFEGVLEKRRGRPPAKHIYND